MVPGIGEVGAIRLLLRATPGLLGLAHLQGRDVTTGRSFRGAAQRVQITVAGIELRFRVAADQPLPPARAPVTFVIDPRRGACLLDE